MAYFANGTEGDYYEEKYCQRCIHDQDPEGVDCCPVLLLHMIWNYDAANGDQDDATPEEKAKYRALNTLWPRKGAHNGPCAMFVDVNND